MSFESLRHIVTRTVRHTQTTKDLQVARLFESTRVVLHKMWGEERARFVTPISFVEGALKLEVTAPAARQQLSLDLPKLKNEINRQLGDSVVKSIKLQAKGF